METLLVYMSWYSIQVKISDITCLYVEVVDLGCIDFISLEDYGSIIAREHRISIYRCPICN
jgi:hypothetical protein